MSVVASSPTSVAGTSEPSASVTVIRSAPSTTCWLVMITPSARTTKPVPKLWTCCSLPSGAKNMSKGDCCTRRRPDHAHRDDGRGHLRRRGDDRGAARLVDRFLRAGLRLGLGAAGAGRCEEDASAKRVTSSCRCRRSRRGHVEVEQAPRGRRPARSRVPAAVRADWCRCCRCGRAGAACLRPAGARARCRSWCRPACAPCAGGSDRPRRESAIHDPAAALPSGPRGCGSRSAAWARCARRTRGSRARPAARPRRGPGATDRARARAPTRTCGGKDCSLRRRNRCRSDSGGLPRACARGNRRASRRARRPICRGGGGR